MAFIRQKTSFTIQAPNFQTLTVAIQGTAPLMVHRFGEGPMSKIRNKQTGEDQKVRGRKRPPKNYKKEFNEARYISKQGWDGFYAGSIRNAMIRAASYVEGLQMTKAKGLIFVVADGFDKRDGTPLVRIRGCKAVHDCRPARNDDGGTDIRNRPRYDNWSARLRIKYDADHIPDPTSLLNLLQRAGESVGICDGRPASTNSNGIGFGVFTVEGLKKAKRREKVEKAEAPLAHKDNGSEERVNA